MVDNVGDRLVSLPVSSAGNDCFEDDPNNHKEPVSVITPELYS